MQHKDCATNVSLASALLLAPPVLPSVAMAVSVPTAHSQAEEAPSELGWVTHRAIWAHEAVSVFTGCSSVTFALAESLTENLF